MCRRCAVETISSLEPYKHSTPEQLLKNIHNGEIQITRLPGGASEALQGTLGEAEACLERTDVSADETTLVRGFNRKITGFAVRQRTQRKQEVALGSWANTDISFLTILPCRTIPDYSL